MMNITRNRAEYRGLAAAVIALAGAIAAVPAWAIDLALPGNARLTAEREDIPDSYALPVGAWSDGDLPVRNVAGRVTRRAWRIDAQGITTLQLLTPLKAQLTDAGYDIVLECETKACGGFDFRFATEVVPEPDMHVDLIDYRFLSASDGQGDFATLLVSRTANSGFVQVIQVTPPEADAPAPVRQGTTLRSVTPVVSQPGANDSSNLSLSDRLITEGRAVLADLTFETGSSDLGSGSFASLVELAAFLADDSTRRVALVGHTDAVGSLDGNIALSKRRAGSVLERLVTAHGVPRSQLTAEGMGYLAPMTTNLTAEGREANRRVEVILLNTE